MDALTEVQREIEELHRFFVDWIGGHCEKSEAAFESRFLARLSPDFLYVMPGGGRLSRDMLRDGMWRAHGTNPDFRIAIRGVRVRHADPSAVLAFYEEWQRNALASEPSDNGRLSTVLFARVEGRLVWSHLQETWLPPEEMGAGDYSF